MCRMARKFLLVAILAKLQIVHSVFDAVAMEYSFSAADNVT